MAAFFRKLLVFELNPGGAGALVAAHRLAHIEQAAVAGVTIADDGFRDVVAQALDDGDHVGVSGDARIRQAVGRRDRAETGHVERIEIEAVGDARRDHIVDARGGDKAAGSTKLGGEGSSAGLEIAHDLNSEVVGEDGNDIFIALAGSRRKS